MTASINASTTAGVVVTSDTSGSLAIQSNGTAVATVASTGTTLAGTTALTTLTVSGTTTLTGATSITSYSPTASLITSSTSQATTSGTVKDFTGIPSWVKRITVMLNGVSTSGTSNLLLQIGTASGIDNATYTGGANSGATFVNSTTGAALVAVMAAAAIQNGSVTITSLGSNIWTFSGTFSRSDIAQNGACANAKTLSGTLTQVRLTTVNGTDTFDAGSVNILYE
jgi:hypothetical protein